MDFIAAFACGDNKPLEFVCENIVFLLCGYDQAQMNATMMSTVASHIPAGTSSYTVIHYAQEIKSGWFVELFWLKNWILHAFREFPGDGLGG